MNVRAYYNEFDKKAAAGLRRLIADGIIAPGDVDERDIRDVRPSDLKRYGQCHFFAGIGVWSYAARLAGVPDERPIWTGSCPCQPGSAAGKRLGFADERHLWPCWKNLIKECRPTKVFGEQVAAWAEWLRLVRGDLEAMDYAVGAMPIQAASAGADHFRDRYWFVADGPPELREWSGGTWESWRFESSNRHLPSSLENADCGVLRRSKVCKKQQGRAETKCTGQTSVGQADADIAREGKGREQRGGKFSGIGSNPETRDGFEWVIGADGKARRVKPGIRLLVDGFAERIPLLRAAGNAIDPRPAAAFIKAAIEAIDDMAL